jgi:hypothetical protein
MGLNVPFFNFEELNRYIKAKRFPSKRGAKNGQVKNTNQDYIARFN